MLRKPACLVVLLFFLCATGFSQQMPPYAEVVKKFYSLYRFEPVEYVDGVLFSKRKEGWYVDIVDRMRNDSVKSSQPFWLLKEGRYREIEGMEPADSAYAAEKISEHLSPGAVFSFYGYERCRYFGYAGWANDMIGDFASYSGSSDTLYDGVGRAYGSSLSWFLWDQFGGGAGTTYKPLGPLEIPSRERAMAARETVSKGIAAFRRVREINPAYQTLIGNASMKVFNEQFHAYYTMLLCRQKELAREFLTAITPDDNLVALGKNYLSNCPPNAILFTFGDNDTYPVWYVQDALGYRTDVMVLNNSLMGFVPSIHHLKERFPALFSLEQHEYGDSALQYALFDAEKSVPTLSFDELIDMVRTRKYPHPGYEDAIVPTITANRFTCAVERSRMPGFPVKGTFGDTIYFKIDRYLLLNDLLTLDIIRNNIYKRPIYFSSEDERFGSSLRCEGLVYRLLPLAGENTGPSADAIAVMEDYFNRTHIPLRYEIPGNAILPSDPTPASEMMAYVVMAEHYSGLGDREKLLRYAIKAADILDKSNALTFQVPRLARMLFGSGARDRAIQCLRRYAERIYAIYRRPDALSPHISKPMANYILKQVGEVLEENNIPDIHVDRMIRQTGD